MTRGQIYTNAYGAVCEILEVKGGEVTYRIGDTFYCCRIDSTETMLKVNGYSL